MKHLKGQFNFNSVLLLLVGGLISFGLKKADEANTALIQLGMRMNQVEQRVTVVEGALVTLPKPLVK